MGQRPCSTPEPPRWGTIAVVLTTLLIGGYGWHTRYLNSHWDLPLRIIVNDFWLWATLSTAAAFASVYALYRGHRLLSLATAILAIASLFAGFRRFLATFIGTPFAG